MNHYQMLELIKFPLKFWAFFAIQNSQKLILLTNLNLHYPMKALKYNSKKFGVRANPALCDVAAYL